MLNKLVVNAIGIGSILLSTSAMATDMTKDEWLGKLKAAVPDLICKGFLQDSSLKEQLAKKDIDYNKCVTLIPGNIDKCQTELYATIPAMITSENADQWGNTLGQCIGKDFAVKNLL
ncbi:MAG: hypothetical protein K2X39_05465 [Silvanigrellaceae bacterium]|nr:hypothetical protein [Silvanigrellaceae bacterium]